MCVGPQVQYVDLLCSMANSPLYLSAIRSPASAVVCARITGGSIPQVSFERYCLSSTCPQLGNGHLDVFQRVTATASCTLKVLKGVYVGMCM